MKKLIPLLATTLLSFGVKAELVVVGNNAISDTLSKADIKKLFLGKKTHLDSIGNVQVIELKDGSEERVAFHALATGRSETQLQSAWSRLVFTGKANAPLQVASFEDVISEVSANTNAIGYVDSSSVNGDVKVLFKF